MAEHTDKLSRLQATAFTVDILEVFLDDFCALINNLSRVHLVRFSEALSHGIQLVFPPPEIIQHQGEDPISQKKMLAGEGTWDTTKELLDWILDGVNYTFHLDPPCCKAITTLTIRVAHMRRYPLQEFQKVAGKL